jgi:hypothetical protein
MTDIDQRTSIEKEMLVKAVVSWWNAPPSDLEPLAITKVRAAIETGEKDDMLAALRAVVSWDGMPPPQDVPTIAKARLLILLAEVFLG